MIKPVPSILGTLYWPPSFPRRAHPGVEPAAAGDDQRRRGQAGASGSVCPVVGVAVTEAAVDRIAEMRQIKRVGDELDDEQVMAHPLAGEHRTDVPVAEDRTGLGEGLRNRSLDLLVDQMLSERGERVRVRPVNVKSGGVSDSKRTVSPTEWAHMPAQVETMIA